MSNAPLLEMRNIKKNFFGNQVLTDINLTLREGEVLGLCGENGAGKSTLMKILFGMEVIHETGGYGGDLLINGENVSFKTPFEALAAGIGMVHQEFSLIPGFTATENILLNREPQKHSVVSEVFGRRLNTLNYKEMSTRSAAAIEKMGVQIDADMVINSMPVGHKQFTEIARELSKDQLKLLILDEPTAVLTEKEAEALLDSIHNMSRRGIAVIFITHRLHEILAVCDKVVVMRDGYIEHDIPAKETSVPDITHWMVGREIVENASDPEIRDNSDAKTIMSIRRLWVDMPGELVRNVSLDVKEGEILGIGGLAGQGKLGNMEIPTGTLLFFALLAFLMWAFLHTKTGTAMTAVGSNPTFAKAAGISVDKMRLLSVVLSTWLGALGILVYEQGFGFIQLYMAPFNMALPTVSAILIGGASVDKASIGNVFLGVILFHTMFIVAPSAGAKVTGDSMIDEYFRVFCSYGVITIALVMYEAKKRRNKSKTGQELAQAQKDEESAQEAKAE